LLAHGRWFSPGTSVSSTTKTGRHDIAEILLKVALNTNNQINQKSLPYPVINHYLAVCQLFPPGTPIPPTGNEKYYTIICTTFM
jgi:hypothetical protein